MKQFQLSSIKVLLHTWLTPLKAVACAEYAFSDLHPAKAWLWLQSILLRLGLSSIARRDERSWRNNLEQFLIQHRAPLIWAALASIATILFLSILSPYEMKLQDQLLLRPTQWAYLQNLTKQSQLDAKLSDRIIKFDEVELQRLSTLLLDRGIKPSVLRFTAGTPSNIELQANEVLFSTLLELLDEMRSIWHLYPSELVIRKTDSAGIVNIKSYFLQYSVGDAASVNGM